MEYRAIKGYYLANETGLNTFGAGGTPKGSPVLPSVGEVASYMVSHSTEVCDRSPHFSPNVFSVTIDGAYNRGENAVPISYVRSSGDCSGSNGTLTNQDVIKAEFANPTIIATLRQYCGPTRSNPCDPITGAKRTAEFDYESAGLEFNRYYHSALQSHGRTRPDTVATPLPIGWSHSYSRHVRPVRDAEGRRVLTIVRDNGDRQVAYRDDATEVYIGDGWIGRTDTTTSPWTITLTASDGSIEVYHYAYNGPLLALESAEGLVTTMAYDGAFLSSVTGPFGHQLTVTNDGEYITGLSLPDQSAIEYGYTAAASNGDRQLASVTYADGQSRQYHYEDANLSDLLTGITDESGQRFSTFVYDDRGRVISSERAGGALRAELVYNADGSTTVTDALGNVEIFHLDNSTVVSRPGVITDDAGSVTLTYRGDDTQLASYLDENGHLETRTYNGDRLASVTSATGTPVERTVRNEYVGPTNARLARRALDDALGVEVADIAFGYDAEGRLISTTQTSSVGTGTSESRTRTHSYNSNAQLQSVNGPRTDVADVTSYVYHDCTTGNACGRVLTVTDALGYETRFETYDAHGNPTRIVDPNGIDTLIEYDARQRVTRVETAGRIDLFTYDARGNLISRTDGTGIVTSYTFDDADRLVKTTEASGDQASYDLDPWGNILKARLLEPSSAVTYELDRVFDTTGRLTQSIAAHGGATTYEYDAGDNLIAIIDADGRRTERAYDELDRLVLETDAAGGQTQYAYDAQDNLISVTDAEGKLTTYVYNGFGDLLSQTSPDTGTTTYTVDAAGSRTSETDARGITVSYSPATAETYFYHNDHLGTPQALTDGDQSIVWQAEYDPFGKATETVATVEQNLRFPGQYLDRETGLHYNYFRTYDPATGRYTQSDPIGLRGGINTYSYALNSPVKYADPFGLEVLICRRKAELPFPMNLFSHMWVKTDTYESGMGAAGGGVPAQGGNSDKPFTRTETVDHSGQSDMQGSVCEVQNNVDEQCVNELIKPGQGIGRWQPVNQCQSFAYSAVNQCRFGPQVLPKSL